jgi:hypothetical protein
MNPEEQTARLDRHALVMALWLPVGFVAVALCHHGFALGGPVWVGAGFGMLAIGYVAHVIVNAVLGTTFTAPEVGLSLVLFLAATLGFVMAALVLDGFAARFLLTVIGGMVGLVAVVVFYMLTRSGVRGAFDQFDIIRNNNPRPSSRLGHRGGRR